MNNEFLIEGYPLISNGVVYLVKGYQHPPGKAIAYPRYNLSLNSKIKWLRDKYTNMYFWNCIKLYVPVVDLERVFSYDYRQINNPYVFEAISFLKEILSINMEDIVLTGSSLIGGANDIDIIIKGADEEVVRDLERLIENNILYRVRENVLIEEYLRKHISYTDLKTYLFLKRKTLLHLNYKDKHINIKLLGYRKGYSYCKDPVYKREFFKGLIEVVKPLRKTILPAKFLVRIRNEYITLETQRELLSELRPGKYYVSGELEERSRGKILCIDRGFIYLVK